MRFLFPPDHTVPDSAQATDESTDWHPNDDKESAVGSQRFTGKDVMLRGEQGGYYPDPDDITGNESDDATYDQMFKPAGQFNLAKLNEMSTRPIHS